MTAGATRAKPGSDTDQKTCENERGPCTLHVDDGPIAGEQTEQDRSETKADEEERLPSGA